MAVGAREEGLTPNISISGRATPGSRLISFDSVLCSTSVLDHFVLSFAEFFIPVAKAKGAAVAR